MSALPRPGTRFGTALLLAAGAVAITLVSSTQLYYNWVSQGYDVSFPRLAATKLVDWGLWAAFVPVIIGVERRHGFEAGPWRRALLVHVATAAAFFAVVNAALAGFSLIVDPAAAGTSFAHAYVQRAGAKLVSTVVVYAAILGGYWLLRLREDRHRQAALSARLRADLSEAELLNLKMQIHPHFLFNTLHTVAALVREGDRDVALETIEELSELLRRALRTIDQQEVRLSEELAFLERFIRIQSLRFGDRLAVELDADGAARDALVPTLLLQPIVENAIRHGLDLEHETGRVTINARRDADAVELSVEDNGTGFEPGSKEGLGLGTTRRRLEQLYNGGASLSVEPVVAGGTCVRIRLPYRPAGPTPAARPEPARG